MQFVRLHYSLTNEIVLIKVDSIISLEIRKLEKDTFVTTTNYNYAVKETPDEILTMPRIIK